MWGKQVPLFSLFKPGEQGRFFFFTQARTSGCGKWVGRAYRAAARSRRGRVRYSSFRWAFIAASTSSNISAVNRPVLVFWRLT